METEKIDGRKLKQKHQDRLLNVRLPNELLNEVIELAEKENISLSRMVRILLYMGKMDELEAVRNWMYDETDNRDLNDVLTISKGKGETDNE